MSGRDGDGMNKSLGRTETCCGGNDGSSQATTVSIHCGHHLPLESIRGVEAQLHMSGRSISSWRSSPLFELLLLNLQPTGPHLFLSYLTTMDLLRVSECCKGTRAYRSYLLHIKVVWHPWATFWLTSRLKRGLVRLFLEQRHGIRYLSFHDRTVTLVLGYLAASGKCVSKGACGVNG